MQCLTHQAFGSCNEKDIPCQLKALQEKFEDMQRQLDQDETNFEKVGSNPAFIDAKGATNNFVVDQPDDGKDDLILNLKKEIDANKAKIDSIDAKADTNLAEIKAKADTINAKGAKIDDLMAKVDANGIKINANAGQINANKDKIATNAGNVVKNRANIDSHGSKVQDLQEEVDQAEVKIKANFETIQENEVDIKNISAFKEEVKKSQRQVHFAVGRREKDTLSLKYNILKSERNQKKYSQWITFTTNNKTTTNAGMNIKTGRFVVPICGNYAFDFHIR